MNEFASGAEALKVLLGLSQRLKRCATQKQEEPKSRKDLPTEQQEGSDD